MNKIILVGSPNTGKTTLYNTLTGQNEKASNYGGVTVEVKNSPFVFNKNIMLYDLPGLYSITTYSPEEKVSLDFLEKNKDGLVVNICDANNLYRNLFLALELKEKGYNICLAINMCDGIKSIDDIIEKLEHKTQIKCFKIDARKRKKCLELINFMQNYINHSIKLQKINKANTTISKQPDIKYKKIKQILDSCGYTLHNEKLSKLDKLLFKPSFAIFSFVLLFLVMFFITFGSFGQMCTSFLSELFSRIFYLVFPAIKSGDGWFASLLRDGIVGAMCSILSFLPQIMLLYFFLNLMEDTGYLSRVAFALDGPLNKIGLSGKSVFSLLMGFGCTTSATFTTRNIENSKTRKRTALVLPFFSCSAKLPIFALICSAFFGRSKFIIVLALYFFGVFVALFTSFINFKISKGQMNHNFILEMPKLKMPYLPKIVKDAFSKTKEFALRVGSVIGVASIIVWFVSHFSFSLEFLEPFSDGTIVAKISGLLSPIFGPLGFSSAVVLALISGLVAKEMVLGTLMVASNATTIFGLESIIESGEGALAISRASAIAFLVFVLLYPVCVSALVSQKQEFGWRFMLKNFLLQLAVSYALSLVAYNFALGKFTMVLSFISVILLVAVCFKFVLKYMRKRGENCYACNHKCENDCVQKR